MNITIKFLCQDANVPSGNATHMIVPIFSTIEDYLNDIADEHQRAKLVRLSVEGRVLMQEAQGDYTFRPAFGFLVLAATSGALVEETWTESNTVHTDLESMLDAYFANEYAYQVLDQNPFIQINAYRETYGSMTQAANLNGSYQPPKGDVGLFVSDEQLDEPESRTSLLYIIDTNQSSIIDDGQMHSYYFVVTAVVNVQNRSVRLAEL